MIDQVVAVDLGGTQIRVALCDSQGHILKRTAEPAHAADGPEAVFGRVVISVREIVEDWVQVRGIALGAPGTIDPWRGMILQAPNLPGMIDFPMKVRLEEEFGVSAFVGNDANLAALGEHQFGAGRGVSHMIYLTISTGIGGGIIVDDQLHLGWRGLAGEVGHQTLDANGPLCKCGNIGCLEVLASGPAIVQSTRALLQAGRESTMQQMIGGSLDQVSGALITRAAQAGDPLARQVYERAGFYIGLGLASLLHCIDTQLFVLGGGVAIHAWDFLFPSIGAAFDQHAMPSMRREVRIVPAELGDDAGLLGAAALANKQVSDDK